MWTKKVRGCRCSMGVEEEVCSYTYCVCAPGEKDCIFFFLAEIQF